MKHRISDATDIRWFILLEKGGCMRNTYFCRVVRDSETDELTLQRIWKSGLIDKSNPLKKVVITRTYTHPSKYVVSITDINDRHEVHSFTNKRIELVGVYPHFDSVKQTSLEEIDLHWHREWLSSENSHVIDIYDMRKAKLPKTIKPIIQLG